LIKVKKGVLGVKTLLPQYWSPQVHKNYLTMGWILIEDALQNIRTPITWSVFRDMPTEDDIISLTYDVSLIVNEEKFRQEHEDIEGDEDEMDEEGVDIEQHDKDEEEEGEEKEDDEETKEETDRDDEDIQEEEYRKGREEEGNRIEWKEHKEESPRVSPEATERELVAALTTLTTLIKKKGKRKMQTPLYFRTRKSTRIRQGKPQTSTKIPIQIEYSPTQKDKMPSPMSPIAYVRSLTIRSTSSKGKAIL